MCCEIWLCWLVLEEVNVWSGRSCCLTGEVLCVCYSDCSVLVALSFRVLCRSAGRWQIKFTVVKTPLQWKKKVLFIIAVWRYTKVFLASAVTCAPAGIWGSWRVLGYQSCDVQVFFVARLHGSSSCPEIKHHSSQVIVVFMDPFWIIVCECFHYSPLLWLPCCSCSHHDKKRREAQKELRKKLLFTAVTAKVSWNMQDACCVKS